MQVWVDDPWCVCVCAGWGLADLGLHGDEVMAPQAGQGGPLDGPTVEEVVVILQVPNLEQQHYKYQGHRGGQTNIEISEERETETHRERKERERPAGGG